MIDDEFEKAMVASGYSGEEVPTADYIPPSVVVTGVGTSDLIEQQRQSILTHLQTPLEVLARQGHYEWLIKNILPKGKHVTLFGVTGVMKTFMALAMVMPVANGDETWAGNLVKTQGVVVYVAGEDPDGVALRVQGYDRVHKSVESGLFYLYDIPVTMTNLNEVAAFCDAIKTELGDAVAVVVIDTADTCFGDSDESSTTDMRIYGQAVRTVIDELGCTVLSIMHPGHTNTGRERGASNLKAGADVRYQVTKQNGNQAVLTNVKMKNQEDGGKWVFERRVVEMGYDEDGDELTTCVMEYKPDAKAESQKMKLSGKALEVLQDFRDVLQTQGKQASEIFSGDELSAERIRGRCVLIEEWRQFAYDHSLTGKEQNTKKTAFNRARDKLVQANEIGVFKDYAFKKAQS